MSGGRGGSDGDVTLYMQFVNDLFAAQGTGKGRWREGGEGGGDGGEDLPDDI